MTYARALCCMMLLALIFACSDDGTIGRDLGGDLKKPDAYKYKQDTGYTPPDGGAPDTFVKKDTVETPDQAPPAPDQGGGVLTAPFTLSFDTNNGNLKGTKDWQWGKIAFLADANCGTSSTAKGPSKGNSGMGMWGTKLNGCYSPLGNNAKDGVGTCSNTNPNDDSILSFKAHIPKSFTLASLIFYQWTDVFYPYDWHEVRVIENGTATVYKKTCKSGHTTPTGWVKESIYIDKFIGKTVTIQLHFMASKSVNYAGWYIDDLGIQNK